jgi:agarase
MNIYDSRDRYGGWTGLQFEATGFFRLEQAEGRWWLVTPEGNAFLSFGVNHVEPGLLRNPYNKEYWMQEFGLTDVANENQFLDHFYAKVQDDFAQSGWNTLGCHNPNHIYGSLNRPYIFTVRFVDICHYMTPKDEDFLDVWSPEFEIHCNRIAEEIVAPRRDDSYLLGYAMIDCPIWSDLDAAARGVTVYGAARPGLLTWPRWLRNLGSESQGKRTYVETMRRLYSDDITGFNSVYQTYFSEFDDLLTATQWRPDVDHKNGKELFDNTVFLNRTVDQYYKVAVNAIWRYDRNHLIFGDTVTWFFISITQPGMIRKNFSIALPELPGNPYFAEMHLYLFPMKTCLFPLGRDSKISLVARRLSGNLCIIATQEQISWAGIGAAGWIAGK